MPSQTSSEPSVGSHWAIPLISSQAPLRPTQLIRAFLYVRDAGSGYYVRENCRAGYAHVRTYSLYRTSFVKALQTIVFLTLLLIAVYEHVLSWRVIIVEAICIGFIAADACLRWWVSAGFFDEPWNQWFVVVLAIYVPLVAAVIAAHAVDPASPFLRIFSARLYLRPLMAPVYFVSLRRTLPVLLWTFLAVLRIAILLVILVLLYAVFGFIVFHGHNKHFTSIPRSFYSLFVTFTTANFPDVMIPSYAQRYHVTTHITVLEPDIHRGGHVIEETRTYLKGVNETTGAPVSLDTSAWTSFSPYLVPAFFISYFAVTLYFLLTIAFAVVYDIYKKHLKVSIVREYSHSVSMLAKAFHCVAVPKSALIRQTSREESQNERSEELRVPPSPPGDCGEPEESLTSPGASRPTSPTPGGAGEHSSCADLVLPYSRWLTLFDLLDPPPKPSITAKIRSCIRRTVLAGRQTDSAGAPVSTGVYGSVHPNGSILPPEQRRLTSPLSWRAPPGRVAEPQPYVSCPKAHFRAAIRTRRLQAMFETLNESGSGALSLREFIGLHQLLQLKMAWVSPTSPMLSKWAHRWALAKRLQQFAGGRAIDYVSAVVVVAAVVLMAAHYTYLDMHHVPVADYETSPYVPTMSTSRWSGLTALADQSAPAAPFRAPGLTSFGFLPHGQSEVPVSPGGGDHARVASTLSLASALVRRSAQDRWAGDISSGVRLTRVGSLPSPSTEEASPRLNPVWFRWMLAEMLIEVWFHVEVVLKIAAVGWTAYWYRKWNRFDFVFSLVSLGVGLLLCGLWVTYGLEKAVYMITIFEPGDHIGQFDETPDPILAVFIIRLLRVFRVLALFGPFKVVLKTATNVLPVVFEYAASLGLLYYILATLGMQIFQGKTADIPLSSPYATGDYWSLNFDSFGAAYLTLFCLMVVNNWHVIMGAYMMATTWWAVLYFLSAYVVLVLLVLNVMTAFILDVFMTQWEMNAKEVRLSKHRFATRLVNILCSLPPPRTSTPSAAYSGHPPPHDDPPELRPTGFPPHVAEADIAYQAPDVPIHPGGTSPCVVPSAAPRCIKPEGAIDAPRMNEMRPPTSQRRQQQQEQSAGYMAPLPPLDALDGAVGPPGIVGEQLSSRHATDCESKGKDDGLASPLLSRQQSVAESSVAAPDMRPRGPNSPAASSQQFPSPRVLSPSTRGEVMLPSHDLTHSSRHRRRHVAVAAGTYAPRHVVTRFGASAAAAAAGNAQNLSRSPAVASPPSSPSPCAKESRRPDSGTHVCEERCPGEGEECSDPEVPFEGDPTERARALLSPASPPSRSPPFRHVPETQADEDEDEERGDEPHEAAPFWRIGFFNYADRLRAAYETLFLDELPDLGLCSVASATAPHASADNIPSDGQPDHVEGEGGTLVVSPAVGGGPGEADTAEQEERARLIHRNTHPRSFDGVVGYTDVGGVSTLSMRRVVTSGSSEPRTQAQQAAVERASTPPHLRARPAPCDGITGRGSHLV
eukprot:TRINITY_DN2123_c0_g3_i1.p1 TRINITY_DN2123_c0_g3~~TRINITY_DN2123_c0_g3_i1.p1  ORF type:complete len:1487 (-),score=137.43 TRINITY_DN2123_c0_g3_i1:171-4631(-)